MRLPISISPGLLDQVLSLGLGLLVDVRRLLLEHPGLVLARLKLCMADDRGLV